MLVHYWTSGENLQFGTSQGTIALHVQPSGNRILWNTFDHIDRFFLLISPSLIFTMIVL